MPKRKERPSPTISVIVLNYNGKRFLRECLDSLFAQQYKDFEILFVDNASHDGSIPFVKAQYANQIAAKRLRVIVNKENLGFAQGNNVGVRAARGERIVLLNNDTKVERDWLRELVRAWDKGHPMLIGALAIEPGTEDRTVGFYDKEKRGMAMNLCGEIVSRAQTQEERASGLVGTFYVGGMAVGFRKRDFPHPFDPSYFAYAEDTYLGWLAQLRGGSAFIATRSRLIHYGGGTKKSGSEINRIAVFNGTKNQIMNFLLFYEWKNVLRLSPLFTLTQAAHVAQDPRKLIVKLKAYVWIAMNLRMILRKRTAIQTQRKIRDRELLRTMSGRLFDESFVEGSTSKAAVRCMNALFLAYCFLALVRTREFFPEPRQEKG